MVKRKKETFFSKLKDKCVSIVHKYVPSLVIAVSGLFPSNVRAEQNPASEKKINKTHIQVDNLKTTEFKYNNIKFDVTSMRPEELGMIYASNYKFNAVYTSKGQKATIRNATGYGPLLTRVDELRDFINNNSEKYAELKKVMDKKGINSADFDKTWMSQDVLQIMKHFVEYRWDKAYQTTFDKLAKAGYPEITYENYNSAENFGYTAAVMSCLGQSKRQTANIFIQAKQRADRKLKNKATLDDYIDASYDIRYEKWGLATRYFGKNGSVGEKDLNKKIRDMLRESQKHKTFDAITIVNVEEQNLVHEPDAIAATIEKGDSLYLDNVQEIDTDSVKVSIKTTTNQIDFDETVPSDVVSSEEIMEADSVSSINTSQSDNASFNELSYLMNLTEKYPFLLRVENESDLLEKKDQLNTELNNLKTNIKDISSGDYPILGRKIHVDYETILPETVGHIYESALDPTTIDAKRIEIASALGLYQFNLNNTMKTLADKLADEFPELKVAKDKYGVKSKQYAAVWAKYSTGPQRTRFERRQLEFMWNSFYQDAFDAMTRSCKLPKITLDNYNNKEYRIYTAAYMSFVNQNPKYARIYMEQAYNRVARNLKKGKLDINVVGLVSYDIRDEKWGRGSSKQSRALHRRYMGGHGVIGEKTLCENIMRFDREFAKISGRVEEIEKTIASIDVALENIDLVKNITKSIADKKTEVAFNGVIADKMATIKKHARNIKELRVLRKRIQKNPQTDVAKLDFRSSKPVYKGRRGRGDDDLQV